MKFLLLFTILLSGCATSKRFLKGFSEGYSEGAARHQAADNRTLNCEKSYQIGNTVAFDCR